MADEGRSSSAVSRHGRPGEKRPLREKVLGYYEQLFEGKDPSCKRLEFWDEFFLLKVNVEFLSGRIGDLTVQDLVGLKKSLNLLTIQCISILQRDDNLIRDINALQTLCSVLRAVFQKKMSVDFDAINVLIGFDSAECQMRNLIESVNKFLSEDYPVSIKNLSLKLLLVVLTATDNISQNVFLEYLMMTSVFESIMQVLSFPEQRERHGYDAAVVLTLLVNYRKYEAANPYVIKLSVLDDEIALNGLGCVISTVLTEYNRQYMVPVDQPVGFLGHLTSFVSNMLVPSEAALGEVHVNEAVLLSLYEAVHLNRNFITILTHTRSASQPATPTTPVPAVERSLPVPTSPITPSGSKVLPPPHQPTNLLGTFFTFSSILLKNIRGTKVECHAKLCQIIITCIAEDQFANTFLHDPNMTFPIVLHRAPLLHRKVKKERVTASAPLACALLDLMVEFMLSHLSKCFPIDLYGQSLGIVHRVICYQKKCKIRLPFNWKELWSVLVNVLKFFTTSEERWLEKNNIFCTADEIVKIFNVFITYGDTFLPDPATYDELYYELIRVHQVFDDLHALAHHHVTVEGIHKVSAGKLTSSLVNIRAIGTHFRPKIEAWATAHNANPITPQQVLEVVRSNYDTLTLKLHDNLDHYDKYAEKPKESSYFTQLIRSVAAEVRTGITVSSLQQLTVLTELGGVS